MHNSMYMQFMFTFFILVSSLMKLGMFIRRLYLFIPGSASTLIPTAAGESIYGSLLFSKSEEFVSYCEIEEDTGQRATLFHLNLIE